MLAIRRTRLSWVKYTQVAYILQALHPALQLSSQPRTPDAFQVEDEEVVITHRETGEYLKLESAKLTSPGHDAYAFFGMLISCLANVTLILGHPWQTKFRGKLIAGSDGYAISQQKRKLIEQGFGWAKFIGPIRQVMVRGLEKVDQIFVLTMTTYNLTQMRSLGAIRPLGAI